MNKSVESEFVLKKRGDCTNWALYSARKTETPTTEAAAVAGKKSTTQ